VTYEDRDDKDEIEVRRHDEDGKAARSNAAAVLGVVRSRGPFVHGLSHRATFSTQRVVPLAALFTVQRIVPFRNHLTCTLHRPRWLWLQVVFVSSDSDLDAFNDYFSEMPWCVACYHAGMMAAVHRQSGSKPLQCSVPCDH
jgi:hypothetical protein